MELETDRKFLKTGLYERGEDMDPRLVFLKQLAHGLAVQFGSSCEVVIHDLRKRDLEHSIVHIENGHVSDRHIGDGPSGVVLAPLTTDPSSVTDKLSYLTKTDGGKVLKSSTMFIRGENDTIDYIFSINYDITALRGAVDSLHALLYTEGSRPTYPAAEEPQKITHSVNELLDMLMDQAVAKVGKPVSLMNKEDKVAVVQYLNNAGAFLITKSGDKVSSLLGISKFTLYSYMDKK